MEAEESRRMGASILLVEDEPGIQLAIRGLLRREGHQTAVASSGSEAIQLLADGAFDLVLTDLSLPDGVSGLDIVRHVGTHQPGTPVILITAYGSEHVAKDAVERGVPRIRKLSTWAVIEYVGINRCPRCNGFRTADRVSSRATPDTAGPLGRWLSRNSTRSRSRGNRMFGTR